MLNTRREALVLKFADCMNRLRALGLSAEITVTGGVVLVATSDKNNASAFRKAIKTACAKTGAVFVETRPSATARVFAISV